VREWEFVQAAKAVGGSDVRILAQHVLPNITAPIIVEASLHIAYRGGDFGRGGAELPWSGRAAANAGLGGDAQRRAWLPGDRALDGHGPRGRDLPHRVGVQFLGDGVRDALDPRLKQR
jgi:peptide/nickel transport system permease protein